MNSEAQIPKHLFRNIEPEFPCSDKVGPAVTALHGHLILAPYPIFRGYGGAVLD